MQENLFSQAPSSTSTQDAGIGNFLFGSKMEDRVMVGVTFLLEQQYFTKKAANKIAIFMPMPNGMTELQCTVTLHQMK